jgi:hypothetical protein
MFKGLSDPESSEFAAKIRQVLVNIGWIPRDVGGLVAGPLFPGVRIVVHRESANLPSAIALTTVLKEIGIVGLPPPLRTNNTTFGQLLSVRATLRLTLAVNRSRAAARLTHRHSLKISPDDFLPRAVIELLLSDRYRPSMKP